MQINHALLTIIFALSGCHHPSAAPIEPPLLVKDSAEGAERDSDQDGILDSKDSCPSEPEDLDGSADEDGCPEVDNDEDGISDVLDRCPNESGSYGKKRSLGSWPEESGCPTQPAYNDGPPDDLDADGYPNDVDQCPNYAESFPSQQDNGCTDDGDGCPDPGPLYLLGCDVSLFERLYFQSKQSAPREIERGLIESIAEMLRANPAVKLLVIGHSDDTEDAALSVQRAEAVRAALIALGIDGTRLTTEGRGSKEPMVPTQGLKKKALSEARERNRAVSFEITAQPFLPGRYYNKKSSDK